MTRIGALLLNRYEQNFKFISENFAFHKMLFQEPLQLLRGYLVLPKNVVIGSTSDLLFGALCKWATCHVESDMLAYCR